MLLALIAVLAAAFGLCVAFVLAKWIGSCDAGTDRMKEISGFIREGAFAFLKREYKSMAIVIVILFFVIGFALDWITAVLYLFGALLSVLAGFFGMNVATKGNVRTAAAAKDSGMNKALILLFCGGLVRSGLLCRTETSGKLGTVRTENPPSGQRDHGGLRKSRLSVL